MRLLAGLWLALLPAAAPLAAAALPPAVAAILPRLNEAERQLQDATLDLEAARRDAEPYQAEVNDARGHADTWWGQWRLRRGLGRLKERLDTVEQARLAQVQAHAAVFAVLTGLEEELRNALELGLRTGAGKADRAVWAAWWAQKQAWSRRVQALEAAEDERAAVGGDQRQLLAEARVEQLERDLKLVDALAAAGVLGPSQAVQQRRDLRREWAHWRARGARKK